MKSFVENGKIKMNAQTRTNCIGIINKRRSNQGEHDGSALTS
jgi:hypothetical protein